ncbi:hypothetical protein [Desulfobacula sp.]
MKAMVCINGDELKKKVVSILKQMGMTVETVPDTKEALKRLAYHIYHLVIFDDSFDQNKGASDIIERMNTIDMSLRRRSCLVRISQKINTNDNLASLHSSVNAIINQNDIARLGPYLSRILRDHKQFYTVYNESLKMAGKG